MRLGCNKLILLLVAFCVTASTANAQFYDVKPFKSSIIENSAKINIDAKFNYIVSSNNIITFRNLQNKQIVDSKMLKSNIFINNKMFKNSIVSGNMADFTSRIVQNQSKSSIAFFEPKKNSSSILLATNFQNKILQSTFSDSRFSYETIATTQITQSPQISNSIIDTLAKTGSAISDSNIANVQYVLSVTQVYPEIARNKDSTIQSKLEEFKKVASRTNPLRQYANIELSSVKNIQNNEMALTPIAPSAISRFSSYSNEFGFDTDYSKPSIIHELKLH